jgi:hypothetical protein
LFTPTQLMWLAAGYAELGQLNNAYRLAQEAMTVIETAGGGDELAHHRPGGVATSWLVVMTSRRSDYYGQLQANEALFPLSERIAVPPLGAEALHLRSFAVPNTGAIWPYLRRL